MYINELFIGRRSAIYEATLLIRNEVNWQVCHLAFIAKTTYPINDTLVNRAINTHKNPYYSKTLRA